MKKKLNLGRKHSSIIISYCILLLFFFSSCEDQAIATNDVENEISKTFPTESANITGNKILNEILNHIDYSLMTVDKSCGILVFQNTDDLEAIVAQLENAVNSYDDIPLREDDENQIMHPVYEGFLNRLQFDNSMLAQILAQQHSQLQMGGSPENLDYGLEDETVMALLNQLGGVMVGNTLYAFPSEDVSLSLPNGNCEQLLTLDELGVVDAIHEEGWILEGAPTSWYKNEEKNGTCDAVFDVISVDTNSKSVTVSYSGVSIGQGYSHKWQWGDGQETTGATPGSHTYLYNGEYTILHTVEYKDKDDPTITCLDVYSETVTIDPQVCVALFTITEGQTPGMFTVDGSLSDNFLQNVEKYEWSINGQQFTGSSATYTASCNGEVPVSLTITTEEGCTANLMKMAKISTFDCCQKRPKSGPEYFYFDGGQKRLKARIKSFHWIFGKYVKANTCAFKQKNNGGWKRIKVDQKVELSGNVFLRQGGCTCVVQRDVSTNENFKNSRRAKSKFTIGSPYRAMMNNSEPTASFYVNSSNTPIATLSVLVTKCDP